MRVIVLIVLVCSLFSKCEAKLPDTATIIHAVVEESSGEPYLAQVAICEVIRKRGSLQGVYGANAHRYESSRIYERVNRAWNESRTSNITHGCRYFGGDIDNWYFTKVLHLKPFLVIGHTKFYK